MILKENKDLYVSKIEMLIEKSDIQWWLYKSVLCKQPLNKVYFNSWYNLFNQFHLILDDYVEDLEITRGKIDGLKSILSSLDRNFTSLENKISEESKIQLKNVFTKLSDYINELLDLIEKHSTEVRNEI